jgi:hypothetical protein
MAGSSRSKALLLVGLLAAAGAVVFLVVGNPFAPGAGTGSGDGTDGVAPEALGGDGAAQQPDAVAAGSTGLQGAFDARGVGDVRVRLLLGKQRKPLADQPVRLVSPKGGWSSARRAPTAACCSRACARRGLDAQDRGKGFTAVEMKPVTVRAGGDRPADPAARRERCAAA